MTGTQTLDRGRGETIPDGCMRGDYIFILVDVRLLEFAQYRTRWFRFGKMDGCEDTGDDRALFVVRSVSTDGITQ